MKVFVFAIQLFFVVYSLFSINDFKRKIQIFPDSLKNEYTKSVRGLTILCIISGLFLLASFALIQSNLFFILAGVSLFTSLGAISQLIDKSEQFGLYDENKALEKTKKNKKNKQ